MLAVGGEFAAAHVLNARYWQAVSLLQQGRLADAAALALQWIEEGEQLRSPVAAFGSLTLAGSVAMLGGRFDEAEARLAAATPLAPAFGEVGEVIVDAMQVYLRLLAGRTDELEALVSDASAFALLAASQPWEVLVAAERGDLETAAAGLARWEVEVVPAIPAWLLTSTVAYVSSAARRLDPAVAQRLYDRVLPEEGRWVSAGLEIIVGSADLPLARYAAAAGRVDEAVTRYERCLAEHERAGEVPIRARAMVELAELLAERAAPGDSDRTVALAGQALEVAERVGLRSVARRAAVLCSEPDT